MTLVVKEASLKEQLGFSKLLCTNRCPHRQEGRPLSRGSSTGNHAGIKQKGQLFWGWSGNYFAMFNKTASPECSCATMTILFPSNNPVLLWYFRTTSTLCQPPLWLSLKLKQTAIYSSWGSVCSTFIALWPLCNSIICKWKKKTKKQTNKKRRQWHLCCLQECIPVCLRCVILHDISIMCGTDIISPVRSAVLFKYISPVFPERVNYN